MCSICLYEYELSALFRTILFRARLCLTDDLRICLTNAVFQVESKHILLNFSIIYFVIKSTYYFVYFFTIIKCYC